MDSQTLELLKEQVGGLTADEQLRLATYLVERARNVLSSEKPVRTWQDLRGLYPHPMLGEAAQTWVSRNRQEGDVHRAQQWQAQR